jgi:parallel beta-helix repeat protein
VQKRKERLIYSLLLFVALLTASVINLNLTNANPFSHQPILRDPNDYYIEVNGTVNPTSAPIKQEGNIYTLTNNITNHSIWILCNDAVFDGAGYTLKSTEPGYDTGLTLNCTTNVTLKNVQVYGYYCGVTVKRQLYVDPNYVIEPDSELNPYPKSSSNTITNCKFIKNHIGIIVQYSKDNQIIKNTVVNNTIGIQIESYSGKTADGNLIKQNQVHQNNEGILLDNCQENKVTANSITQNTVCGLELKYSSNNKVYGNSITENEMGILVEGTDGSSPTEAASNTINNNQIANNNQWGIRLNGSQIDNRIYANNFIDNNINKGLQVSIPMYMHTGYKDSKVYVEMLAGRPNTWNTESAGNYWSDYQTRYPNATENADVWDTPFYINENNIDQHPLTNPLNLETPMPEQEQVNVDSPTTPPYTAASTILAVCVIAVVCLLIYRKRSKKVT